MYIPWPKRWEAELPRKKVVVTLFLMLVGPFCLLIGSAATIAGDYGIGLSLLLALAVVVAVSVLGYVSAIAPRNRGTGSSSVQVFRDRSTATTLYQPTAVNITLMLMWLVLAVFLLAMPTLVEDMPIISSRSAAFHVIAPFLPVFAIPFVAYLFSRVVRKRGLLGVGLSAEGVYHWWWFGCSFFAWEWIDGVRVSGARELAVVLDVREPQERPVNEEENWVGRWDYYRSKRHKLYVGYLAVNPAVAYYALAFYHRHPELRAELGTEASVRRIQRMDFPELISEMDRYGDLRTPGQV